jgi:hypothetical protein
MALWQKLWLVFASIWVVVAALQVGSILALSEEPEKALLPAMLGVAVPAAVYFLAWLWINRHRFRGKRGD